MLSKQLWMTCGYVSLSTLDHTIVAARASDSSHHGMHCDTLMCWSLEEVPWQSAAVVHACSPQQLMASPLVRRFVKTTDGSRREFKVGDVLFQVRRTHVLSPRPHSFAKTCIW